MGKRCNTGIEGGLTVEAAFVMSVVMLALVWVIRTAWTVHDQTTGAAVLYEALDTARRRDNDIPAHELAAGYGGKRWVRLLYQDGDIQLTQRGNSWAGTAATDDWQKEIQIDEFEPETFLRRVYGLLKQGE